MSLINDYTAWHLAGQRQRDFAAEAADHRLVRLARTGRQHWWQRALASVDQRTRWRPAWTHATVGRQHRFGRIDVVRQQLLESRGRRARSTPHA